MTLGENIYRLRTEKNLSQGDLANALEVSRQSVSKWENNSAVPELDKLIRMAQIFGITIDELVTDAVRQSAAAPAAPAAPEEPRIIYIEKPVRQTVNAAQILGIILTACSLLALILMFCFGDHNELAEAAILCLTAAGCGIFCIVSKHPLLWCSWGGCVVYWVCVFVLSARWEAEIPAVILGALLIGAALLYTVKLHQKGAIHVEAWVWASLAIVLSVLALLLCINLIPFS